MTRLYVRLVEVGSRVTGAGVAFAFARFQNPSSHGGGSFEIPVTDEQARELGPHVLTFVHVEVAPQPPGPPDPPIPNRPLPTG